MNFLLHRHLAALDLRSPIAGIGAMLPDLWRMADRRVRPARTPIVSPAAGASGLTSILAGIDHHLRMDRWFHAAPFFVDGERATLDRLREARFDAPKLTLFAHISWELCLDGALLRRDGLEPTLRLLRDGFRATDGPPAATAASLHHFDLVERTSAERQAFDDGMQRLFMEIARGPWVSGYQDGAGVARRIDGMRRRLGLGTMSPVDRARFAAALDDLRPLADTALVELLISSERRA